MQYESPTQPHRQRLTRSAREKMIAGVAGGLAEYFDLDPVVMRLIWIAATILTGGLAIPVYLVMWWVMPRADEVTMAWAPAHSSKQRPIRSGGSAYERARTVCGPRRSKASSSRAWRPMSDARRWSTTVG